MQDRYAGDIGDFGKFSLLTELSKQGLAIGINWYKTEPMISEKNNDGGYIEIPLYLRECNPKLAEKLSAISKSKDRSIMALEEASLIPGAVYFSDRVSVSNRFDWHNRALTLFKNNNAELVFLDPDNGLLVPSVKEHHPRSIKYCFYSEVAQYIETGCSVLVYNHRSRKQELKYFREIELHLRSCLSSEEFEIFEITFPRYSVRDYFAIARPEHSERINAAFATMMSGKWVETGMCQKPLTMGATYSEYRNRFSSAKVFLQHYTRLPEEVVRQMINNDTGISTVSKACMYSTWKENLGHVEMKQRSRR